MNSINLIKPELADCPDVIMLSDAERQPCEVWTRVMGYHRPVSSFNHGKQAEFRERTFFVESCNQNVAGDTGR